MEVYKNEKVKREALEKTKVFVLDMDGTFYLSDDIFPFSIEFLDTVKKCSKDYMFFTNNSSNVSDDYIIKLAKMGVKITKDKIMTSGDVAKRYLNTFYKNKTVYLVGMPTLINDFKANNINIVNDYYDNNDGGADNTRIYDKVPDVVMLSFDKTLTYDKLEKASSFIRLGATFLSTHPDINCPTKDAPYFIPDCGAFCKAIELSTGATPRFLGKPHKETLDMVADSLGLQNEKEKITFVGDRLYTDIAVAVNNGARGALVLSGESTEKTIIESDVKPSALYRDLGEMSEILKDIYKLN